MKPVKTDPVLHELESRVIWHANDMGRTLPEIRFFILDRIEFASLLEKHVYPTSPVNIWEGKRMVTKKFKIETGQESSLYYEVVQTGNPSYAYLNNTNSPMMQASVMAHVVGHCEFSELNVLQDSNPDRTEYVMHLVKKVNMGQQQMGEKNYIQFWNAAESVIPMIAPHSQYNLARSVEDESFRYKETESVENESPTPKLMRPYSYTMDVLLQYDSVEVAWEKEQKKKDHQEQISRKGFRLYRPCQDILGFLCRYAPTSRAEKAILDYMYVSHSSHDFVIRSQIMNEGWAMYWEKKIMLKLFAEKAVKGVIDYASVFSGVCSPRPFFMRNPYHLGYHLWNHIEELYRDGKVELDFIEETDQHKKETWQKPARTEPVAAMEHLVRTITDYEFLRRFLSEELVEVFYLNRIPKMYVNMLGLNRETIIRDDSQFVWLDPQLVKEEMLMFFT
ncbi:MAG: SpoVR family protein, partial [bacterium]